MDDTESFKREMIVGTALDIQAYIYNKYGVEVEEYEISEFINFNLGFLFNGVEELTEDEDEQIS